MTALLMMMSVATAAECTTGATDCVEFDVLTTQNATSAGTPFAEYRYELEFDAALAADVCAAATAGARVYVEWEWSYGIAASPVGTLTAYAEVDAESEVRFWRPGVYDRLKRTYGFFDAVNAGTVNDDVAWEFDLTTNQACGALSGDILVVTLDGEVEAAASPGGPAPTSPASASASMGDIAIAGITGAVVLHY